jgi:ElaB/YqjD/DUF883 family membrane-anchored ribosome-binding protein
MSQTISEKTAEHFSESVHQASQATRAAANAVSSAIDEGTGAVQRAAKQSSDMAGEFFDDTTRLIRRQPVLAVAATGAVALSAGVLIGWMMQRKSCR